MTNLSIGDNIAALRKEKGVTQEALAEAVGVSGQAVSKWESGGSPDTLLLPAIADYFGVPIDRLFDREICDEKHLFKMVVENLRDSPDSETRMRRFFTLCWVAAFGDGRPELAWNPELLCKEEDNNIYSGKRTENGVIQMGQNPSLRYFLLMPEPEAGWGKQLYFREEYVELFTLLSDADTLKTLFFLYSRLGNPFPGRRTAFTTRILERELGIPQEKGEDIIKKLNSYGLIGTQKMELNGEVRTICSFADFFSFIPFMTFAGEIIKHPHTWINCMGINQGNRPTPWLRHTTT